MNTPINLLKNNLITLVALGVEAYQVCAKNAFDRDQASLQGRMDDARWYAEEWRKTDHYRTGLIQNLAVKAELPLEAAKMLCTPNCDPVKYSRVVRVEAVAAVDVQAGEEDAERAMAA
jgi:hypothetical protein